LFFVERTKNKKKDLVDYPFTLFTIRTIPSRITGTLHLKGYQVAGFFLSVLSTERKKTCSLCVLCASLRWIQVIQSTIINPIS